MKRTCLKLETLLDNRKEIYVDIEACKDIITFLNSSTKNLTKLKIILKALDRNLLNRELYEKYTNNVSVMKFTRGRENARIYCQYTKGIPYRIIMAEFLSKKSTQHLNKKLSSRIKAISNYEYEIFKATD